MSSWNYNMNKCEYITGEMRAITERLGKTLDSLDGAVRKHLSEWESDSKEAYDIAKANWDAASNKMHSQAMHAQSVLTEIDLNYRLGEANGRRIWDRAN